MGIHARVGTLARRVCVIGHVSSGRLTVRWAAWPSFSVAFDAGSTGAGSLKFKIIAVCSGAATSTGTGTVPATSTAGSKCSCLTRPAANAAPGGVLTRGDKGIQVQTDT